MIAVHVLNGPNLDLLGRREPEIDGGSAPSDLERPVRERAEAAGVAPTFPQSDQASAQISIALRDGVSGSGAPTDEAVAGRARLCRRDLRFRSVEPSPRIRRDPTGPERQDASGSPEAINR
jgi:3-dehydroquinate dehydratase II